MKKVTITNWGEPGQMQVNALELTITYCTGRFFDDSRVELSRWVNVQCGSMEELEKQVSALEKRGYHLVG